MKLFGWRAVLTQTQTDTKFSLTCVSVCKGFVCQRVTASVCVCATSKSACGFTAYVTTYRSVHA